MSDKLYSCTFILFFRNANLGFEEQILQYVNAYRQSKNLPPLEMNASVSSEALKHSTAMAGGNIPFGHDGFDDRAGSIKRQLSSAKKFAENVAYGHLDAKQVVDIWLNSRATAAT